MMIHAIAAIAAAGGLIGVSIGAFGIGGVFLPPLLVALGLDLHRAMATSLFTFVFTGLVGTIIYRRGGNIDWYLGLGLGLASIPGSFLGARVNVGLPEGVLKVILGLILLGSGLYIILQRHGEERRGRPFGKLVLAPVGLAMGFISGLTGIGGPLLVVPAFVILGTPILVAVGVSQIFCILSSLGGSAGYMLSGTIDYDVAALILLGELPGVFLGGYMAHRAETRRLRKLLGFLCLMVGVWMLFYLRPGA